MNQLIEVKTAELEGAALDWAVAKALEWTMARVPNDIDGQNGGEVLAPPDISHDFKFPQRGAVPAGFFLHRWSSDWSRGGPLIAERGKSIGMELRISERSASFLQSGMRVGYTASSVLIAACRAIVAAKLGETVAVPAELLP